MSDIASALARNLGIPPQKYHAAVERFWARVEPMHDDTGCWEWNGPLNTYGRPSATLNYRNMGAHRLAYLLFVGPIPDALTVDHLCFNRRCVNPRHLEAVTLAENVKRYFVKLGAKYKDGVMTHCIYGHKMTPENTRAKMGRSGKYQHCRKCLRESEIRHNVKALEKRHARMVPRTHCENGHPWVAENLFYPSKTRYPNQQRCKTCNKINAAAKWLRKKTRAHDHR